MQVFRTEWLATFSGSPAFFAAFVKNSPILFFPRGARLYHTGSAGFLLWFIVRNTGRKAPRVSSFLQDDGWRTLDTNELALNTSLERCKCTWLVHSAIFFTDVHEKSTQQNVELVRRNVFQGISTGSCLRVTMAFVCKLSQLFQFAANRADKNPDRGPYRKKLDRLRARDKPIRFEDLRFRPAEILQKKIIVRIYVFY